MPMHDEQRRAYLQRAGVTAEQISQTVGELPIHEATFRTPGMTRERAEQIRRAIRPVIGDASIIAAKYSAVARGKDTEAPKPDEVEEDRRHLEELFAPEYTLHNPFGAVEDRRHVIDAMLSGMIDYDGMGRRGFESVKQSLQILGDSAVVVGFYRMSARGRAKNLDTGRVYQQDLSGNYQISNTYVHRDGRWQTLASQMTTVPTDPGFVLTNDE